MLLLEPSEMSPIKATRRWDAGAAAAAAAGIRERRAPLAVTQGRHIDRRLRLAAGSWAQGAAANGRSKRLV